MCGIAGVFRFDYTQPVLEEEVADICSTMVHRGPDDSGVYVDGSFGMGMRRLAIVDLAGGAQPLANEDGSIWVVCNGEIYNSPELRHQLEGLGHKFRCRSDAEVIPHLYEQYGTDFVRRLAGMFGLALWDSRRRRLVLARDRVGIKPLFYRLDRFGVSFGSELKAILRLGVPRKLDLQTLSDFLSLGYIPTNRTIYQGIEQLPPAHYLVCEAGRAPIKERYWSVENFGGLKLAREEDYIEAVVHELKQAIRCHLLSDVPIGVFLSGGLDSSTIVALMSEVAGERIKTFSIGFPQESFDELGNARLVAKRYATEHYELVVKPDAATVMPQMVKFFDEPFADSSALPVFYVSKLAREHVKVVMSGEGGDEVFAGYETYAAARVAEAYRRLPRWLAAGLIPAIVHRLPVSHERISFEFRAKRFVNGALRPPADSHFAWKELISEDAKRLLCPPLAGSSLEETVSAFRNAFAGCRAADLITRLQFTDLAVYLHKDILVKVDRMSMANSLETRVPFLDHRVIELAASLPRHMCLRGLTKKYVIRRAMSGRLPREIITGKKKGFAVPVPAWLRNELNGFMRDLLCTSSLREMGIFEPKQVEKIIDDHCEMRWDHSRLLWSLMVFVAWHREYMAAPAVAAGHSPTVVAVH